MREVERPEQIIKRLLRKKDKEKESLRENLLFQKEKVIDYLSLPERHTPVTEEHLNAPRIGKNHGIRKYFYAYVMGIQVLNAKWGDNEDSNI